MTKLLFTAFLMIGCCGVAQAAVPCGRSSQAPVGYPSTVYMQRPAQPCPCGCGCAAPCHCGCQDNTRPCTCHR